MQRFKFKVEFKNETHFFRTEDLMLKFCRQLIADGYNEHEDFVVTYICSKRLSKRLNPFDIESDTSSL